MAETPLHMRLMFYAIFALRHFFRHRQVYVWGNNFVYYEKGDIKKRVSPDCYVVLDAEVTQSDAYKIWDEGGRAPDVVFEFTSKDTQRQDTYSKRALYQDVLMVQEYFLFDPTGDHLKPRLKGLRLEEGAYRDIELVDGGRMYSEQLGLELVIDKNWLRFFDPMSGEWLPTPQEQAARADRLAERLRALGEEP